MAEDLRTWVRIPPSPLGEEEKFLLSFSIGKEMMKELDHEYLKTILDYDSDTGIFTWLTDVGGVKIGQKAGSPHARGYEMIKVAGKSYLAHRLAFFWMTGRWPVRQIDHRNGNKLDNSWKI